MKLYNGEARPHREEGRGGRLGQTNTGLSPMRPLFMSSETQKVSYFNLQM